MKAKLRVARATNNLESIAAMYRKGLGLDVLGSFKDHAGFDGIMLGHRDCNYHFEFTQEKASIAPKSPSPENLIIFYIPDPQEWSRTQANMQNAGFKKMKAHNPYWDENGCTFEDPEEYRVVLCKNSWNPADMS